MLDFGLARPPGDPCLTEPGHVIGTPAYMAPERVEGKVADERADIYALGLILVEMATGHSSRFPKDLPPALERVIKRCLETDPDERWQSARDLQWELESIAQTPPEALSGAASKVPAWVVALAAITILALVVFALLRFGQRPALPPLVRMNILLPEKSLRPVSCGFSGWALDRRGSGQGRETADLDSRSRCTGTGSAGWNR